MTNIIKYNNDIMKEIKKIIIKYDKNMINKLKNNIII